MSAVKFASITASLLARKGEAQPWTDPEKKSPVWQPPEPEVRPVTKLVQPATPSIARAPQKKCALRMSAQEYEQLGILAVKRDCTRQQLLREALSQLVGSMARDYPQCPCVNRAD